MLILIQWTCGHEIQNIACLVVCSVILLMSWSRNNIQNQHGYTPPMESINNFTIHTEELNLAYINMSQMNKRLPYKHMVSRYTSMSTGSENPARRSNRWGRIRISELQAKNIIAGASYLGPILFLALHRSILGAFITYELDWPKWLGFVWHAHGGPTMTVKQMTGENLKSPPLPLLPHQIWYICKPCWLLLLSRARSFAFGLAVATRRSSCERCLTASEESALEQWELWGRGEHKAPVIFLALGLFLSWSSLFQRTDLRLSWSMLKAYKT